MDKSDETYQIISVLMNEARHSMDHASMGQLFYGGQHNSNFKTPGCPHERSCQENRPNPHLAFATDPFVFC